MRRTTNKSNKKNRENARRKNNKIPQRLYPLFWSYDPKLISIKRDKAIIITRVLNYGNWEDVKWLFKIYSESEIKKVIAHPQRGHWWKKALNFWVKVFDIKIAPAVYQKAIINVSKT